MPSMTDQPSSIGGETDFSLYENLGSIWCCEKTWYQFLKIHLPNKDMPDLLLNVERENTSTRILIQLCFAP